MRQSDKGMRVYHNNQVFGVDFHDFIQKGETFTMVELASEFGLSVKDVKKLKKQIERA